MPRQVAAKRTKRLLGLKPEPARRWLITHPAQSNQRRVNNPRRTRARLITDQISRTPVIRILWQPDEPSLFRESKPTTRQLLTRNKTGTLPKLLRAGAKAMVQPVLARRPRTVLGIR